WPDAMPSWRCSVSTVRSSPRPIAPGRMLSRRQVRDLDDRPDFDCAPARPRNPRGDGDRLVEIPGIDQEVAAQLFARLRERAVGHQPLALADPDAGRRL